MQALQPRRRRGGYKVTLSVACQGPRSLTSHHVVQLLCTALGNRRNCLFNAKGTGHVTLRMTCSTGWWRPGDRGAAGRLSGAARRLGARASRGAGARRRRPRPFSTSAAFTTALQAALADRKPRCKPSSHTLAVASVFSKTESK